MMKRVFGNLYFLTFLNGFLLASLFYFKMEANYEKELFSAIHSDISSKMKSTDNGDTLLVNVLHTCHNLLAERGSVFIGKYFGGIKSDLIEPASMDLMTGNGSCGSYSIVMARVLQGYQFQVRIAQMKSYGVFSGHILVEVNTVHGWVVLDPLFDQYFVNPSNKLASFDEVKNNWNYYTRQLPPGYDMHYRYEDVRYSNWSKIPFLLPSVKKILDLTIGKKEADDISIRTYFLRKYNLCFNIFAIFFILVFSFTLVQLIKAKVFPQKNIPVTISNVNKYLRLRFFGKSLSEQGQA
jgi:hypothetical protein